MPTQVSAPKPNRDWLRFWSPGSWRTWRSMRPAWRKYRTEERRLRAQISQTEVKLSLALDDLKSANQSVEWSKEVGPRDVPIKLAKNETGLALVNGVDLLEIRKKEGKNVWTPVDRGVVAFTDRQVVFTGKKEVKFRYSRLTNNDVGPLGLLLGVSTRRRSHVLAGPAEKISALITACMAHTDGALPSAPFVAAASSAEAAIATLESEKAAVVDEKAALLKPERPISPAWVPISALSVMMMLGTALAEPSPVVVAAADSTTTSAAVTSTPTLVATTTTTPPGSDPTSTLPEVANSDVLFATASAGVSGDPNGRLPADAQPATVVAITDGDTMRVQLADGTVEPLRLIGINSPERSECWADEAATVLLALAPEGSLVGLVSDVSDTDQFNRLLRYVWVGSFSINQELVRRGAALSRRFAPDTAMAADLEAAQVSAREAQLGLWAPDACGPRKDVDLTVVSIEYDAPGDDNVNLNEEWVRIRNQGDNLVDMSDWGIRDESASNRFAFPIGFVLASGESVTVYSGCGDDFGTTLFWCSTGSAIWNNDGDTAFLTDPSGNVHDSSSYVPATTTTAQPITTTTVAPTPTTKASSCHPSYTGQCVPVGVSDVDCLGGTGDGPYYTGRVTVVGPDVYRLDHDSDGIGCENS